jgi:hypothetical protein
MISRACREQDLKRSGLGATGVLRNLPYVAPVDPSSGQHRPRFLEGAAALDVRARVVAAVVLAQDDSLPQVDIQEGSVSWESTSAQAPRERWVLLRGTVPAAALTSQQELRVTVRELGQCTKVAWVALVDIPLLAPPLLLLHGMLSSCRAI